MTLCSTGKTLPTKGGVKQVRLLDAAEFLGATDSGKGSFNKITLKESAEWAEYSFFEGDAMYEELIKVESGTAVVIHKLTINLCQNPEDSITTMHKLIYETDGIVALVTLNCGQTLLVGYSSELGKERPLKIESSKFISQSSINEIMTMQVVLQSIDSARSRTVI